HGGARDGRVVKVVDRLRALRRTRETVLIVPIVEAETPLADLRQRYDRSAASGVPAHVTVLYPFVPLARVDDRVLDEVAAVANARPPFDVVFERIGRFPGVLYLAPDPADVFIGLTEACVARFPQHQPYRGAFAYI